MAPGLICCYSPFLFPTLRLSLFAILTAIKTLLRHYTQHPMGNSPADVTEPWDLSLLGLISLWLPITAMCSRLGGSSFTRSICPSLLTWAFLLLTFPFDVFLADGVHHYFAIVCGSPINSSCSSSHSNARILTLSVSLLSSFSPHPPAIKSPMTASSVVDHRGAEEPCVPRN